MRMISMYVCVYDVHIHMFPKQCLHYGVLAALLRIGSVLLRVAFSHLDTESFLFRVPTCDTAGDLPRTCRGSAGGYVPGPGQHFWLPKAAKISIFHKENEHFLHIYESPISKFRHILNI